MKDKKDLLQQIFSTVFEAPDFDALKIEQQDFISQFTIDIIIHLSMDSRWQQHGYIDTHQAILIVDDKNMATQRQQHYRELHIPTSIEKALDQTESQKYYVKINLNQKFIDYISSKYQNAKCIESETFLLDIAASDDCYLLTETASIVADEKLIQKEGYQFKKWEQHPATNTPLNSTNKIKINGLLASLITEKTREAIIKDASTPEKLTKDAEKMRHRYLQFILEFAENVPTLFYKEPKVSTLLQHRCPALNHQPPEQPVLRQRKQLAAQVVWQDGNEGINDSDAIASGYCSPGTCAIT